MDSLALKDICQVVTQVNAQQLNVQGLLVVKHEAFLRNAFSCDDLLRAGVV